MFWNALNVAGDCSYTQTFNYLIPIPSLWLLLMSLSISRKRAEECFRSYHDDLCIFSIPLVCWLKQESWLRRKCYHSRVNNILQILCQKRWAVWISVGSWAIKLGHEIPISVSWSVHTFSPIWGIQITVLVKKKE